MRSSTLGEPLTLHRIPIVVFAAMFGATVAGQLAGMAADTFVIGRRIVWVPLVCSVVLEALVGARLGAAKLGRPLTWRECVRISGYYSMGLAVVSAPLAMWTLASNRRLGGGVSSRDLGSALGFLLAWLLAATALRHVLMTLIQALITPRASRGDAVRVSTTPPSAVDSRGPS